MSTFRQLLVLFLLLIPVMACAESLDAAKSALDAGEPEEAESILAGIDKTGEAQERDELFYLLSETARFYGHYSEAGNQLSRIEDPVWAAMGYYNLAMSYLVEQSFQRVRTALRITRSLAEGDDVDPAAAEMANRARIAEGLLALRGGNNRTAIGSLSGVRTDSILVPQGLYLLGIARARAGNIHRALQTWRRVGSFPIAHPGVAEARIARVWAHRQRGRPSRALSITESNRNFLEDRINGLESLMQRVRNQGAGRVIRSKLGQSQKLVEFLREGTNITRSSTMAWFFRFLENGGSLDDVGETLDREFLAFLESQEKRLKTFKDRALQQQALLFESLALQQADERPIQRGGWQ